jgi:hypothetical protein
MLLATTFAHPTPKKAHKYVCSTYTMYNVRDSNKISKVKPPIYKRNERT